MLRELLRLLRQTADRPQLAVLAGSAVAAVLAGFVLISPPLAEALITHGGYYYILGVFAAWVYYGAREWRTSAASHPRERGRWLDWAVILAASAFAIWSDPFKHKVLFDEYVLQGTAYHLHATREIGTVVRAYNIDGTWLAIDTFLDKRPYFFVFLVGLVHDLTGFRIANIFAVNVALTPVCLALVFWLTRALAGRGAAVLSVLLLATMPLLGQQSSGAGMELHNLTMIAATMAVAVLYTREPSRDRLSLLVLSAVLLSQSRYESVIFVLPVAVIVVAGWWRVQRIFLSWPVAIAPLLLVPYAWQSRVVSATPLLWQLGAGQTTRFSIKYLPANLRGAARFFFNSTIDLANSWYLSALGAFALLYIAARLWRRWRASPRRPLDPVELVMGCFGLGIVGNLAMLMFYYWSSLDDVIASRFALPMCFLLALAAGCLVRAGEQRRWPALRLALVGLVCWLVIWDLPAISRRLYTDRNLVMQELEWEHSILLQQQGPLLFLSNTSTIPFVLWKIPTLLGKVGRQRGSQIAYHLRQGTFKEVLVAQALRPTSLTGDRGVDPDDTLPPAFHLQPVSEKRFGARWIRVSRIVAIDPAPTEMAAAASVGPTQ